jgi:hypothetical protein
MKYLAIIPGSKMINGSLIDVVDHVENKGVILKDRYGKVTTFIKVECNEAAAHYALELSKFAMACASRKTYEMDFEMPVKKQANSK